MAFNDRDRNVRVKAWIPRSKGNEGRDDLEPDNIQSSASWDPADRITGKSGQSTAREACGWHSLCSAT